MKAKYVYPLALIFAVLSCKKNNEADTNTESQDTLTETAYSTHPDYALSNKNAQEYISILEKKQADLQKKLRKVRGEEANSLLSEYHKILKNLVDSLNIAESNALKDYNSLLVKNELPDSIQKKVRLYEKLGIYFKQDPATDTYLLDFRPGYFYEMFKNKVTPDVREFLQMRTEEKLNPVLEHKEIIVSWQELRDRTLKWEQYVKKHPKTRFIDNARRAYSEHLTLYLFGTENQPTYEFSNKKLLPEIEQEFVSLIKKEPKTITAKTTKDFLDYFLTNNSNYKAQEFQAKLREYTKAEIEKHLK